MLQRFGKVVVVMAGAIAMAGIGCQDQNSTMHKDAKPAGQAMSGSLYSRLGGEPAIRLVVNDFVALGAADPAVNFTRKGHPNAWEPTDANVNKLKERLVQFIGMATGGPQRYQGASMPESHRGMQITDAEFDALAKDLQKALEKNGVPANLQNELLTVVASTRKDIVGK